MSFILPLIFLLLTNLTNVVIFKKGFGKLIPLAFIIPTLIMYLTGIIFDSLIPGYIISILYSLIGIGYAIYKIIKRDLKTIKENYFDLGFILFLIVYVLVYIINIGKHFTSCDEFGYWGYVVKLMLMDNKIFVNSEIYSAASMITHPPFISIWEYLYCKITGGYSEAMVCNAIQLFEFVFLIPFASYLNVKDKKINILVKSILLVFTVMLAIYQIDTGKTAMTAYTDAHMMLYYAYCFGLVLFMSDFKNKKDWFIFALASSGFLLNKQIVLPLYLVIIFYICLKKIIDKYSLKKDNKKQNFIKTILPIIVLIIVPLLAYKSWGLFIGYKYTGIEQISASTSIFNNIINFAKGIDREIPRQIISRYVTTISEESIYRSPLINLGFFSMIIIGLAVLIMIYKRYKESFENSKFIAIFWSIVAATLGYAFTFLILYAFGGFPVSEGLRCASYLRYFSSFILAIYAIIFIQFLNVKASDKEFKIEYKTIAIIMAIVILLSSNIKILNFIPAGVRIHNGEQANIKYIENANIIKNNISKESKVLIISNDVSTPSYTRYYIPEYFIELVKYSCQSSFEATENYLEEFPKYLENFDYVFISDNYEFFENNFSFLFDGPIVDKKIYEIVKDGENIKLKMKN